MSSPALGWTFYLIGYLTGDLPSRFRSLLHRAEFTLPGNQNCPAELFKRLSGSSVMFFVFLEFFLSEFSVAFGRCGNVATRVPVPETPMHENHGPVSWKHNVRFSWEACAVKAKAKAQSMQSIFLMQSQASYPCFGYETFARVARWVIGSRSCFSLGLKRVLAHSCLGLISSKKGRPRITSPGASNDL